MRFTVCPLVGSRGRIRGQVHLWPGPFGLVRVGLEQCQQERVERRPVDDDDDGVQQRRPAGLMCRSIPQRVEQFDLTSEVSMEFGWPLDARGGRLDEDLGVVSST